MSYSKLTFASYSFITSEKTTNIAPDLLRSMQRLWNDIGLQYCLRSQWAPNYYDPTTVNYFLGRLDIIASQGYLPTLDDVLRMRIQVKV